jgi:hypothetical protein
MGSSSRGVNCDANTEEEASVMDPPPSVSIVESKFWAFNADTNIVVDINVGS